MFHTYGNIRSYPMKIEPLQSEAPDFTIRFGRREQEPVSMRNTFSSRSIFVVADKNLCKTKPFTSRSVFVVTHKNLFQSEALQFKIRRARRRRSQEPVSKRSHSVHDPFSSPKMLVFAKAKPFSSRQLKLSHLVLASHKIDRSEKYEHRQKQTEPHNPRRDV